MKTPVHQKLKPVRLKLILKVKERNSEARSGLISQRSLGQRKLTSDKNIRLS